MKNRDEKNLTRAEVSRITGISERMLRYYESKQVDLLHPSDAGYGQAGVRYNQKECLKAVSVGNYLDMGFTISQIKEFYDKNNQNLSKILDDQIEMLEQQIEEFQLKISSVKTVQIPLLAPFHMRFCKSAKNMTHSILIQSGSVLQMKKTSTI